MLLTLLYDKSLARSNHGLGTYKMTKRQQLIEAYMSARKLDRNLTIEETAGFMIVKYGAAEALAILQSNPLTPQRDFWLNVINELRATFDGP